MTKPTLPLLFILSILVFSSFSISLPGQDHSGKVKVWEETIILPTYFTDLPEECPVFFQHKSYQGASRVAYPYPVQDRLTMERGSKEYKGLFLENEFIKLCVLPEIGGRLFYATDKTNGYEIFYRQHVVKPMLVGMLGAWISGGVEFCVFHHHRASTHMPVDYRLEENDDGSATIWIGEFEQRHRMRWNIGISLYPERSWVDVKGTMINDTENVNSMLYWANVAVSVNEDYQVFFPTNTQYATYHAKNSFAHWPVTRETYNGIEYYKNNVDASLYRNHPMQGSFFAHDIDQGLLAGYDWSKSAGTMSVANHNIVKGAKLWQWGTNSTFDREALTDEDGPYAELMIGAYSDNQPDYSWIKPYEVKKFRHTWYPLRDIEGMKHGNLDAVVNLEVRDGGRVFVAANTTKLFPGCRIILEDQGESLLELTRDIGPALPFSHEFMPEGDHHAENMRMTVFTGDGKELISYQPEVIPYDPELPPVVVPPGSPSEYNSTEELFYAGERIGQFHNARLEPADYFLEALRRDPLDVRCNTAMGIIHQEEGDFESAKFYYRQAINRLTANYTRPRDCEPLYHMGVILKQEGKLQAAIDTLYRAAWDQEFSSAAYLQLAQIYSLQKKHETALEAVDNALMVNSSNLKALGLKTSLLRKLGNEDAAIKTARALLDIDHMNYYAHNELSLMLKNPSDSGWDAKLNHLLREYPENYLELASYYLSSGLYSEAIRILEKAEHSENEKLSAYPTIQYYLGFLQHLEGDKAAAEKYFTKGGQLDIKYCFPFRLESIKVYKTALEYNKKDSRACYYLGNLLYDRQPEKAIGWWEKSIEFEPGLAMAHRNLGWAYQQTLGESERAIDAYRIAINQDPTQARFYSEMDHLLEDAGVPIQERLEMLTTNHEYVSQLQSAVIREILVLMHAGEYDRAIVLLDGRKYYRQEDVNIIHDIHAQTHLLKGIELLEGGKSGEAMEEFARADSYPENQMIERPLYYEMNPRIFYFTALAFEAKGEKKSARAYFEKIAALKDTENEFLFYRGMALEKLGNKKEAMRIFEEMIDLGESRLEQGGEVDFFAKFGDEMTENQRQGLGYLMIAMGHLGLGEDEIAAEYFKKSLAVDVNQLWAAIYLTSL